MDGRTLLQRFARFAALWAASGAAAAQVMITPVVVELGPRQQVTSVSVSVPETAPAALRLQADVLRWEQGVAGEDVTEPTDEVLVTPVIAEVRPGRTQVFRIALRGSRPSPAELAYRLILEDIGEPTMSATLAPGMSLNFRMRHDLPVLFAPVGKVVTALRWKPCSSSSGEAHAATAIRAANAPAQPSSIARAVQPRSEAEACVRILNAGNRRVKVKAVTLSGNGWEQDVSLGEGQNVLAGAERELHLPARALAAGSASALHVQTAAGERLKAEPGGF